ncbi:hypothetical protein QBC35DRAFT_353773, partial [Podospora australis]
EGSATPVRQNTTSSTTTVTTVATLATNETATTPYSLDTSSPGFPVPSASHAVFSARDGSDLGGQRRPTRRRTGPLSALQRERASLIRKMGACHDCKRRRVACHPSHHNTTWEGLNKKFGPNNSPTNGRLLSPALSNSRSNFTQDPQEMELDPPTMPQPSQTALPNDARIRTPLPSGPRPMTGSISTLPGGEVFRADLQGSASRMLANPLRSRYANVSVLLVRWEEDDDAEVKNAVQELADVFKDEYNYMVDTKCIPTVTDASNGSWLWLSREVTEFVSNNHQRDILKIFYYIGYSCIGRDRDTIISSSKKVDPASSMAWQPIQSIFENICSDALLLMDCAYYPLPQRTRQQGMLQLIAASAGEDYTELLGRSAFTRALSAQLKTRPLQLKFREPFTAAELHAKLLSEYPRMVQERDPGKEILTRFPTPLMFQISGNKLLPSILLAPLHPTGEMPFTPDSPAGGSTLSLTFSMSDDTFDMDSWAEWLRSMPPGIREVKVEGPHRNTFR